jgi:hypothetical protein
LLAALVIFLGAFLPLDGALRKFRHLPTVMAGLDPAIHVFLAG